MAPGRRTVTVALTTLVAQPRRLKRALSGNQPCVCTTLKSRQWIRVRFSYRRGSLSPRGARAASKDGEWGGQGRRGLEEAEGAGGAGSDDVVGVVGLAGSRGGTLREAATAKSPVKASAMTAWPNPLGWVASPRPYKHWKHGLPFRASKSGTGTW